MMGLLARYPRKQRDVESIADEPHVDIVAADRQETEPELQYLGRSGAVDDRIEIACPSGILEVLADVGRRLVFDADDVIGAILLGDGELGGIASEGDHRGA